MANPKCWRRLLTIGVVLLAVLTAAQAVRSEKAPPRDFPIRMNPAVSETPSDVATAAPTRREDQWTKTARADSVTADADAANPMVEPGAVKWHDSFADACNAAKDSGKPVLLFQMMGKLDQRFC